MSSGSWQRPPTLRGSVWVNLVTAAWDQPHGREHPRCGVRFGRTTQTLLAPMDFGSSQIVPKLCGWVWVDRPKLCGMMGSWSSKAHPQYGEGFGSSDPNLVGTHNMGWVWVNQPKPCGMVVFGRPGPALYMLVGLGRPTQTFWNGGAWSSRPNPRYAGGFGSTDPKLPRLTVDKT
jgi:hypothetical protein